MLRNTLRLGNTGRSWKIAGRIFAEEKGSVNLKNAHTGKTATYNDFLLGDLKCSGVKSMIFVFQM